MKILRSLLCVLFLMRATEANGSFVGQLFVRLTARVLVRSGILLHPCTHLAATAGTLVLLQGSTKNQVNQNIDKMNADLHKWIGKKNKWAGRNMKIAGLGMLNGILFASTVGLYWYRNPISPTSGVVTKFLSRCMFYGIAPISALANAYLNPLIGGMAVCHQHTHLSYTAAKYFSVGMLGAASTLAFIAYGPQTPCAWLMGVAAIGALALDKGNKDRR
jgi:hypothetical protein